MSKKSRISLQLNIIRDLGYTLSPGATVLDLGCGNGAIVNGYQNMAFRAYGCDFQFKTGPLVSALLEADEIRLIAQKPYRLPFDDNMFDLVVSDQVLEHVQDYPQTLAEIKRVLKPGGVSLHFFPSRYKFIEPHVKIPLAASIQNYWWLRLWTSIGIRNDYQKDMCAKDAARRSFDYLHSSTNYLTKSQIRKYVSAYFAKASFAEGHFLHNSFKGKSVAALFGALPFFPALYSAFRGRVLVFSDR